MGSIRGSRIRRRPRLLVVLLCMSLAVTGAGSASAAERGSGDDAAVVGAFGLGDGLEAMIDERDGSGRVEVPVAGLGLAWISHGAGVDRFGFGTGWGIGVTTVDPVGGVRVSPPSGGSYPADPTQPSGLAGYGVHDLRFDVTPGGVLAARGDGVVGETAYTYTLVELGRTTTYFDDDGLPVARVTARGERADWRWDRRSGAARLLAAVTVDGVVTELDWEREPGAVLVHAASNLPSGDAEPDRVWRVELDGGRLSAVEDPLGGRTSIDYDDGLVSRTSTPSGAVTDLTWRAEGDRVPRLGSVRVTDHTGAELGFREWRPLGDERASGWPLYGGDGALFRSGDPAYRYRTEISDGATRVRSTYRSVHTLETRDLVVTTPSGEHVLRHHEFGYPAQGDGGLPDPDALPGNWSRPERIELTFHDRAGASRTARSEYEADEFGRVVREVAVDGVVTETAYDPPAPGDAMPPVGLAVRERVSAPDGSVTETRHELDGARRAVVATETFAGTPGGPEALTRTARTEFTVEADGFVSEQRAFAAGDVSHPPVVTRRQRTIDLRLGERTVVETLAAGSPAETTVTTTESLVHGGLVAETDPLGNRSTVAYDPLGRPVTRVDAAGRVTRTGYERAQIDGRNAVTTATPDGVVRTDRLDPIGRVELVTDNLAGGEPTAGHERVVERRAYPDPGTVVVTDAWGATTSARQDALGREVETVAATGATTFVEYDDVANTVTTRVSPTRDPAAAEHTSVERLDASGRSVERSGLRADGGAVPRTATTYDGFGRTVQTDDERVSTRTVHDPFGNPVRTESAGSAARGHDVVVAERRFDGFGVSLEKTLRGAGSGRDGETASAGSREVDELGRVRSEVDPVGRDTRLEYTPDGLIARLVAGSGQVVEHAYDPATREPTGTTTTSPVGDDVRVQSERDPRTDRPNAVFDPADRAGTELRFAYDGFGNTTELAYPDGRVIRHAYDEHGRLERTTDAAGRVTVVDYDEAGRMLRAVQRDGEAADAAVLAEVGWRYDTLGRVTELLRGNGVVTAYTYTSLSEIASETTTRGDEPISEREYTYDPGGRLVERIDRWRDSETGARSETVSTYEYDAFDRLIRSSTRESDAADEATTVAEYELTVGGDIRSERVTRGHGGAETTVAREFEYSPLGELLAVTTDGVRADQEYDVAGNLTRSADGVAYAYDAANRPVAETVAGRTTETTYWADGSRRARAGASGSVTFYWDGEELLTEDHDGDPNASSPNGTASYLLGAGRHARTVAPSGGAPRPDYFVTDRHGNVTELTDADGRSTLRYAYSDYGRVTVVPADGDESPVRDGVHRNPFQYAGGYADESGRLWLRVRTYDPAGMRFTTMDVADLLNGYHYADLNPIMMVDPNGRMSKVDWTDHAAVLGVVVLFLAVTVVATVFTGGWSLSALGVVGMAADVVAMAKAFCQIDADAREASIDPIVEHVLFTFEVIAAMAGGLGALHGVRAVLNGSARALERLESRLVFAELETLAAFPDPLPRLNSWIRNAGGLTADHISGVERLVTRTVARIDADVAKQYAAHFTSTMQMMTDLRPIRKASLGDHLTRPLRAEPVVRRITEQTARYEQNIRTLQEYRSRLLDQSRPAIAARIAEVVGAGEYRPSVPKPAPSGAAPPRQDATTWYPPEGVQPAGPRSSRY